MLAPISTVIAGTEVFYIQQCVILMLTCFTLFAGTRIKLKELCRLDKIAIIYVCWISFSFWVSEAVAIVNWDPQIEVRRCASLLMTYSFGAAFLVGRVTLRQVRFYLRPVIVGMICTFILTCGLYYYRLEQIGRSDLYLAREAIGQRLPFVVCFVAVIALVLSISWRGQRLVLLAVFLIGLSVVALSLTRAAYLQLAASILVLGCYLALKKPKRALILLGGAALLLVIIIRFAIADQYANTQTVVNRVRQIGMVEEEATTDSSGNFRLAMWHAIADKMSTSPMRWIVGYGQLGASFVVQDIEFNYGVASESSAHSQYMDVLVREGLVGEVLYCLFFTELVRVGIFRFQRLEKGVRTFTFAHSIALIGVAVYGVFHESVRYPLFGYYFWLYAGIAARMMSDNSVPSMQRFAGRRTSLLPQTLYGSSERG